MIRLQSVVHGFSNSICSFSSNLSLTKKAKSATSGAHTFFIIIVILVLYYALGLAPCVAIAEASTVALAWDPSSGPIAGYKVHYGTSSHNYSYSANVGNNTSCSISGLEIGQTYYFAATAYDNQNNISDYSDEISYTIPMEDSDGDGISDDDEIDLYGTDPDKKDTDGDGLNDFDEISLWGGNWYRDYDGDGFINLIDTDSDNDGVADGVEVQQGTDPGARVSASSNPDVVFAVNSGGPEYVSPGGVVYRADNSFSGGSTYANAVPIDGTEEDSLYQSERYGNFSYDIPLANGNYLITFKFAEIFHDAANRRVFDVIAEGNEIINNLDVFARAGKYGAYDVTLPVSVFDGVLNIRLSTVMDNAKLSAFLLTYQ